MPSRERRNESEAVRAVRAAQKRTRRSTLAEEVRRLAADRNDARERRAVSRDMDAICADWPE